MNKVSIAFVKFGGMTAGGADRWLQYVAAELPKNRFDVTYFYSGSAAPERLAWMRERDVRLVRVAEKGRSPTGEWVETDLFEHLDESRFDIIQTAIAGPCEWPYPLFTKPVVQRIALDMGADLTSNVCHAFFMSHWLRRRWSLKGGSRLFSSVIPFGFADKATDADLRHELGIPQHAVVAGFHQREDDDTFSPIPLAAFTKVAKENTWFILMGGSRRYQEQAALLGIDHFRHVPHSADPIRISAFLNTLDVFAQGRRDGETFGYVFAEALLHQKPCLGHAAECNAHRETMGPGGLWANSREAYTRHLERLLSDPALRRRLADAGYAHALHTFDNQRGLAAIIKVYEDIYAMPQWKRRLLRASRAIRVFLRDIRVYTGIALLFRVRRKILHLTGRLY